MLKYKIAKQLAVLNTIISLSTVVLAVNPEISKLNQIDTIYNYGRAIAEHDLNLMKSVFVEGGTVVSTSKGQVDAKEFFEDFLPYVSSGEVNFNNLYIAIDGKGSLSASFDLDLVLTNGEEIHSHFIDEFHFAPGSNKLKQVVMYESPKFRHNIN